MRQHQPQSVTILYTAETTDSGVVQSPEQTRVVAVNGVRQTVNGADASTGGIPDVITFINTIYAANGFTRFEDDVLVDREQRLWRVTLHHPGGQNQPCEYMWVHHTDADGVVCVNRLPHPHNGERFETFCERHPDWEVVSTLSSTVKGTTCSVLQRFLPAPNREKVESLLQKSTLTEEQATQLVDEIDRNAYDMLKEERLLVKA